MTNDNPNDDSLEIATPSDFLVGRDADDELQPVIQELPGVEEQVRIIPLTMGDAQEYGDANGNINPAALSNEQIAEILNEHWFDLRESDRELDGDDIESNMIAFGIDSLVTAVLRASGFDLQRAMNMEQLDQIDDPGKLQKMMELSDSV